MQQLKNYTLVFCILFTATLFAQLPQNCGTSDRLLIMGDSWAQYMYDDGVHDAALDAYGHADKKIRSDVFEVSLFSGDPNPQGSYYAVSGSEAREWRDESTFAYLQNVRNQLNANPQIKLVVFSAGGNDVLAGQSDCGWYKNMDLDPDLPAGGCGFTNELTFFNKIESDITWIINEVLAVRPDIEVLISSYDYPNFNVTTFWGWCLCDLCDMYACPKRLDLSYDVNQNGSIDGSELITDAEINQMMIDLEGRRQAIATANPRIHFDNSMGLTHHIYGYAAGSPGSTPYPGGPPNYTPGGDPAYPSYRDNFRLVDVPFWPDAPADPIHLSPGTYYYKVKNQMDRVIFEEVRGLQDETNHQTFWSEGSNDGYVDILENDAFNSGLRMGDEDTDFWTGADSDFRTVLSFNTNSLPANATVTGASLYIIRSSEESNPFLEDDRNPVMDIKSGHFGSSAGLEVADGTSTASAVNAGCFIGNATVNKRAVRIDVDAAALQYVNTSGRTQFRLYFDFADWADEYINFYDGAGNAGLTSPSQLDKNNKPVYKNFTKKKTPNSDGTYTEEIIAQNKVIQPKEGFVFEERLVSSEEDENGVVTETFTVVLVVEHPGLAKYMADYQGAPANGYAPFLDVSFVVPLPIELASFQVRKEERNAALDWVTATEFNSAGFEIQHSTDAQQWKNVGWVDAKGTSNETVNYDFLHEETVTGINYYRLKMVDESGTFEYSDIRSITLPPFTNIVQVFPNPFKDQLQLSFNFETNRSANLKLVNVLGEVLYENTMDIPIGNFSFSMPVSHLPKGTYFVSIEMQNEMSVVKVVKE